MLKKVGMLGAFATGKTSLVSRFVHSIFSERYHTTIGTKIDKKIVTVNQQELTLVLWDIHGEDQLQQVPMSYLRGSSGYLLVVDGTRRETLVTAAHLQRSAEETYGELPFVLVLNKADLEAEWELDEGEIEQLARKSLLSIRTSAKTGVNVERAFAELSRRMLASPANNPVKSATS